MVDRKTSSPVVETASTVFTCAVQKAFDFPRETNRNGCRRCLSHTPDASTVRCGQSATIIKRVLIRVRRHQQSRYNVTFCTPQYVKERWLCDVMLLIGPTPLKDIRRVTQRIRSMGVVPFTVEQDDMRLWLRDLPAAVWHWLSSYVGHRLKLMGRKAVDFLCEKGHRTPVAFRNNELS